MNKDISLPKVYNSKDYENDVYKIWEESGFFNPDNLKAKKSFTISMPPPNATGILHLGHAATLTYEDLMIRYKRLKGYKTLYLPGTDHAAIATQTKVEKILDKEGLDRHTLGRDKFLQRVRDYVKESQGIIRNQIRRMGCSCDWSRERYTLDEGLSEAVSEAFIKMYEDDLIYRGHRIVNWCSRCGSTLADDEVEYNETDSKLYYIKYGPFTVATTRPETKLADTGIAVHPDDDRYKKYIGKELDVDLAGHKIKVKVFSDKEVDQEFGSGVVGVTPAHSTTDYHFAEKHDLEIIKLIDENGIILSSGGKYKGFDVEKARKEFVKDLEKNNQIVKIEDFKNNLSICYRCNTPIEPLVSEQWFVAVDKKIPGRNKTLKQLSLEVVENKEIKILPERFEKIYFNWMNNLHDWCISRQIWWGHRIPVWYTDDNKIIVAKNKEEANKKAKGKKIVQDSDTLDTWFSSSLWTFSTLGWPEKTKDFKKFHPTNVMETGVDIIFFWVARMILMSEYLLKDKPFSTLYLHGMIRDKQGRKMSKSLGNGIDPIDMIDKFGTDALRLSLVIGSSPGADLRIYEEKIAGYRNFVNKIWNISRFILSSVDEVRSIKKQPKTKTLADKWILSKFNKLIKEVNNDLDNFKFSLAGEKLYHFTWDDFADWYLEISKIEKNKDEILLYILERLLILLHPFIPFITETIWKEFNSKDLLIVKDWPKVNKIDKNVIINFTELKELIIGLRNLKSKNKIKPTDFPNCYIKSNILDNDYLKLAATMSRVNLINKELDIDPIIINTSKVWINLKKELSDKEKEDLKKYIISLENKLKNKKFTDNAPKEVINQAKINLKIAKDKLK